jgi:hypothetical protein
MCPTPRVSTFAARRGEGKVVSKRTIPGERSPFALEMPSAPELDAERGVRYLLVSGRQDDVAWGPIGAFWLSRDTERGGFLVHPWAIERGSEMARSHRAALARGFSSEAIFDYWANEPWTGANLVVDRERRAGTLALVSALLDVL